MVPSFFPYSELPKRDPSNRCLTYHPIPNKEPDECRIDFPNYDASIDDRGNYGLHDLLSILQFKVYWMATVVLMPHPYPSEIGVMDEEISSNSDSTTDL